MWRCIALISPGEAELTDAPFLAFPLLLAQGELLDLAGGGLGEVSELHSRRGLEARYALLAEVYDLLFRRLLTLLEGDIGLRALAPFLVGHGDYGDLHNSRVLFDGLLYLDRRDVFSPGDDDVLFAVPDLDVPVRMPHGDVLSVEPATLEGLLGF